jgi:heparin/heparan-sulfate lyase
MGQSLTPTPLLLIGESDPFTGITALKSRYAAGHRPSDDMEGWALSWKLTGQEAFAERAVAKMKSEGISKGGRPSRAWLDYTRWALAFNWLQGYRGLDKALQTRIADELHAGAAAMLATADFKDPAQYSYHNYSVRYLALPAFAAAGLEGQPGYEKFCGEARNKVASCLANILDTSNFVSPDGSYHESMDYMRITWASLVLIAELQRTTTGVDPAFHFPVFENIGNTYLYKLLPDGTPSREGDNEYPVLDTRDTTLLGYSINRFKDPYSAWLLRKSGFFAKQWMLPVLEFLWDDREVVPRDPALAKEGELSRQRYFRGVGHLVMRNGWKPDSTWIEFDCGPYLAKHQHLSQNQFTIYHKGYLAIDTGADYTETESPHYLNYFRRTVAHNSVLVYDPSEKFFWSDNVVPAVNDGGQRMNSARYWNTIRSRDDWERTRDLWNLGTMRVVDHVPEAYHYALGDATEAYSASKLRLFTRELTYLPGERVLLVFDHVISTNPAFHKAWLLHGVNPPQVDDDAGSEGTKDFSGAKTFRFHDGQGELSGYSLLPRERLVTRRGGPGNEFYTPGDDKGGAWGSGQNWPLDPAEGGPLPDDPKLREMWKKFWGDDLAKMSPSNRKNVVPGSWRIEVAPSSPADEDFFLHVLEIGDQGTTGKLRVEVLEGVNLKGVAIAQGSIVLFGSTGMTVLEGEVSLPDFPCNLLMVTGLEPDAIYELSFGGLNVTSAPNAVLPGVSAGIARLRANAKGILRLERKDMSNLRLRIARIR